MLLTGSSFPRDAMAQALATLAKSQVYLGTSSWKYPGWMGMLYDEQRYVWRSRFSQARFEEGCLEEYAQVFSTVCVDAGYYRFPPPEYIAGLASQVPPGFKFCFKVTDEITARTFPALPRHGNKAGQRNEHFLDAELFRAAFLASCEPHRDKIGLLIFEFSHFHPRDFERGRDFVDQLDAFLGKLPQGWQYGVEVRNRSLLQAPYFEMLRSHGVTHVFNSWTRMPSVLDQLGIAGAMTNDDFAAGRFLLKPGRPYEEAVKAFSPYNETKDIYEEARRALAELVRMRLNAAVQKTTRPSFFFVNNRLEGNALLTLFAVLADLGLVPPLKVPG